MPDHPSTSFQCHETPWEFIRAVEARFGRLAWDLAASEENAKAGLFFTEEQDSLKQVWEACQGNKWCNPPFKQVEPWVKKAWESEEALADLYIRECRVRPEDSLTIMLVLASIGSCWFADHVHEKALVLGLSPRLTFVGQTNPYPKDLMLVIFGVEPGFDVWRWKP